MTSALPAASARTPDRSVSFVYNEKNGTASPKTVVRSLIPTLTPERARDHSSIFVFTPSTLLERRSRTEDSRAISFHLLSPERATEDQQPVLVDDDTPSLITPSLLLVDDEPPAEAQPTSSPVEQHTAADIIIEQVVEQPIVEHVVEQSIVEQPIVVEQSIVEQSIVEQSIVEQSIVEQSIVEQVEQSAVEQVVEQSIVEQSVVHQSVDLSNQVEQCIDDEKRQCIDEAKKEWLEQQSVREQAAQRWQRSLVRLEQLQRRALQAERSAATQCHRVTTAERRRTELHAGFQVLLVKLHTRITLERQILFQKCAANLYVLKYRGQEQQLVAQLSELQRARADVGRSQQEAAVLHEQLQQALDANKQLGDYASAAAGRMEATRTKAQRLQKSSRQLREELLKTRLLLQASQDKSTKLHAKLAQFKTQRFHAEPLAVVSSSSSKANDEPATLRDDPAVEVLLRDNQLHCQEVEEENRQSSLLLASKASLLKDVSLIASTAADELPRIHEPACSPLAIHELPAAANNELPLAAPAKKKLGRPRRSKTQPQASPPRQLNSTDIHNEIAVNCDVDDIDIDFEPSRRQERSAVRSLVDVDALLKEADDEAAEEGENTAEQLNSNPAEEGENTAEQLNSNPAEEGENTAEQLNSNPAEEGENTAEQLNSNRTPHINRLLAEIAPLPPPATPLCEQPKKSKKAAAAAVQKKNKKKKKSPQKRGRKPADNGEETESAKRQRRPATSAAQLAATPKKKQPRKLLQTTEDIAALCSPVPPTPKPARSQAAGRQQPLVNFAGLNPREALQAIRRARDMSRAQRAV